MTKLLLCGLINRDGAEAGLLPLARSWIAPPDAKLAGAGSGTVKYDPAQRAFAVARPGTAENTPVTIQVDSSVERPLVNPAFEIEGWNKQASVRVLVDGKSSAAPVRFGIEHHLSQDNAVVYVEMTATKPVEIRIEPAVR